MLHTFLTDHHDELIRRCREKEAKRSAPSQRPTVADHGVPMFVQQLSDTLRHESLTSAERFAKVDPAPLPLSIGRAAALHGAEVMRLGYTVDQVVRDYGDVCQTVTEMAIEQKAHITIGEFRTLNRCLDDAIADAVTAFGRDRKAVSEEAEALQNRLESIADDQRRLIDTALQAFSAVRTGSIGFSGATGTVLMHTLLELRDLARSVTQAAIPAGAPTQPSPSAFPKAKRA